MVRLGLVLGLVGALSAPALAQSPSSSPGSTEAGGLAPDPETLSEGDLARYYGQQLAVAPGDTIPAFSVADFDRRGAKITDRSLRGRTVLVDFWATWCGPCVAELPDLRALQERYADRGFVIFSVSQDAEPTTVDVFRSSRPMPWLHNHDPSNPDQRLANLFGVQGLPTPFLVGPDGVVIATGLGARGYSLEAALAEHFGEPLDPEASDEDREDG